MLEIQILMLSSRPDPHQTAIEAAANKISPVSVFESPKAFAAAVNTMAIDETVLIALVRDETELDTLLSLQKQFSDHPLILVLNSTAKKVLKKASRLYPRYISYFKEEYSDISQVLEKLTIKIKNRFTGGHSNV